MKGYRFYEEFDNKRKGISNGNVVAVIPENRWTEQYPDGSIDVIYDVIGAVFYHPNSDVCGTGASQGYLSESCKRVSESKARKIHPKLFEVLDMPD